MIQVLTTIERHWQAIALFILAAITVLSLSPLKELPSVPGSDKTHHLVAYGALMFPVALKKPPYWWLISLFFISWSGTIEIIQPYVNRYGEWHDLLANIIGLVCGWFLARLLKLKIK